MKFAASFSIVAIVATCLIGISLDNQAKAAGTPIGCISAAKEYMVKMFKDKILSKSTIVMSFQNTMAITKERYSADVRAGKIDESDKDAASAAYYKILIEEVRKLRESVKTETITERSPIDNSKQADEDLAYLAAHEKMFEACSRVSAQVSNQEDIDLDAEREEFEELELLDTLNSIEREESEMGFSMSEESRAAIKARTKKVLGELLSNEVRQLALTLLSSYVSGGVMGPVISAVMATLKLKLAEYFMNIIMDLLSNALGQRIELTPMSKLAEPKPVAVAA